MEHMQEVARPTAIRYTLDESRRWVKVEKRGHKLPRRVAMANLDAWLVNHPVSTAPELEDLPF